MNRTNETCAEDLLKHWDWVVEKGLMNQNTAGGYKAACKAIVEVLDEKEREDVTNLDVEGVLKRFGIKSKRKFKPSSFEVYRIRFKRALQLFIEYAGAENPLAWKPTSRGRSTDGRADKNLVQSSYRQDLNNEPMGLKDNGSENNRVAPFLEYPYPIRNDQIARLLLPRDLKQSEAKKLGAFIEALASDV